MSNNSGDTNSPFYQESFRLFNHTIFAELRNLLLIDLPPDLDQLFKRANVIYNNRSIRSPFDDVRNRKVKSDEAYLHGLLFMGVQEGIRGCYYHLQRFLMLEQTVKMKGEELITDFKPQNTMTIGISGQALIFEYEGFTFLSRVTLDRLNWFFNYYFLTNSDNLYKLYKELGNNYRSNKRAQRILQIVDKHRDYLDTQIAGTKGTTERDRLAHRELIDFANINIIYNHHDKSISVVLIPPGGTPQDEAGQILSQRFGLLKIFINDVIEAFVAE